MKDVLVHIDPVQAGSGDPSPDNVRPITGWTGAKVMRTGVNIWDEEWEQGGINPADGTKYSGTSPRIRSKNYIPVKPSTTYYFSSSFSFAHVFAFYDANKNFISGSWTNSQNCLIPQNAYFLKFCTSDDYGVTYNNDISINYPATATAYEPYSGQTYDITFPSEAGTVYGGTLDVTKGELVVDKVGFTFDGTENWKASEIYCYISGNPNALNNGGSTQVSSHYKTDYLFGSDVLFAQKNGSIIKGAKNDVTAWKAYLAEQYSNGTPVEICYTIATPITYQLTPQEITSLLGTNNVWADTGSSEVKYCVDPTLLLDNESSEIQSIKSMIAGVESSAVATKNYSIGDLVIVGDTLYEVTAAIASGETISVSKVRVTTVDDVIRNRIAAVDNVIENKIADSIDATLTQSGQAADAKVVGDEIEKIENTIEPYEFDELFSELQISESQNLYNKDTAEDGYIAANGNVSQSTTYCHSAKIPVEAGKTYTFWALYNGNIVSANARFLCAYDTNGDAVNSAGSNSAVPSYTVPTGINSIVVSFEQNRKHLFMVVEGSETPNGLLPYNLEHYIAKPSFISNAVGNILRANEQIKITVENATANTEYTLVEHLDNKKNCEYSFFGKFTNFTSIEIGHGKTETAANYLVIDGTNITSYRPNGAEYAHYAHNLSINDFISVSIKVADTASQRATVTIITNGGSATIGNVIFFGCNGAIYFACGQETTEVDFAYSIMDLRKDIYVFGDSYISLADDKRWPNYAIANKDNNMLLSGFPGADASEEFPSFENILSMGTPKYLCWFLGMNNKETSAQNVNWIVATSQVINTCKAKGIVPILATIPNTPTQNNTYKNSWVKASGERYVDFARAVGAEELRASWYEGMLSGDNVHPTAEGAKALWLQLRLDVPEIMQSITT